MSLSKMQVQCLLIDCLSLSIKVNVEGKKAAEDAMEGWQKSSRGCNSRRRKRATVDSVVRH